MKERKWNRLPSGAKYRQYETEYGAVMFEFRAADKAGHAGQEVQRMREEN